MRWIVYGAGAVGGVVGGRLSQAGHDVTLIARGAHADAIRRAGLRIDSPDGSTTVHADVVTHPRDAHIGGGDDNVVLLAVKSHHTHAALEDLASVAPTDATAIVCLQNGVDNERQAARRFAGVYGVCVMCPTGHLEPGVVEANSAPITGLLDVGRYPNGSDTRAEHIAETFRSATFGAEARPDIMRWKHAKLLMNLANAVEAICGPDSRHGALSAVVREEGVACLTAAGIPFASDAEDKERRGDFLQLRPIAGRQRAAGSSWQSLRRGTGSIEADYLNGEIVLLGRLHGVPTPANALVQRLANELATARAEPGSMTEAEVLSRLEPHR